MRKIEQLVDILKNHEVYIQTHNCPDPDAIASAFAMQSLLLHYDVKSKIVYQGTLGKLSGIRMIEYFNIEIFNVDDIPEMAQDAYVIIVDAQKYNKNCTDLPGIEVACIDHHPVVIECDEYLFKDIRHVGACSSIIAEYFYESEYIPSSEVATALLYGIKMDTNDFGRGVEELDVEMYYRLFPYSDQVLLGKLQLNTLEIRDLKAYGAAIENISLYKNVGFAMIPFDCPDGLIAIISDFILALDVVEFTVVYSVRDEGYKFSIRSELESLDAGKIVNEALGKFGGNGGGHSFMAGGFLSKDNADANDVTRNKIENVFLNEVFPGETIAEEKFIRNNSI